MSTSIALLNRLRDLTVARPRPKPIRYPLAVLSVATVALLQSAISGSSAPWFLYTLAVVVLSLFLGRGPGIVATILAALRAGTMLAEPGRPLLLSPAQRGASIIFVATTISLVILVEALRTALLDADRLRDERERAPVATAEREGFLSATAPSPAISASASAPKTTCA